MLAVLAIIVGVVGMAVAGTSPRGVVVGVGDLELNLYSVNLTGGLLVAAIGVLALIGVLSATPVPLWVASGLAGLLALYGLAAWRDDTRNPLGLDGRTISLLLGLALSFAALAWAASRPPAAG